MKLSFHAEKCIQKGKVVSKEVHDDLYTFIGFLVGAKETASKHTHYDNHDEWSTSVYDQIRKNLKKYGFISGDRTANEKNVDASFWWEIYQTMGSIIYSPNLKTFGAAHHASALERNNALLDELTEVYKQITTVTVDRQLIENIIRYCEEKQVYDKLGAYGDFYYKLKTL